uniref:Cysteine protease n=1 Tax=Ixodes ricinus TaxID=34613 RepID=V5GXN7_IXORI
MLRSSQMILAQAFVMHLLGRQWRWQQVHTEAGEFIHRLVARWFGDKADASTPFSLHNLVQRGRESGKKAGDWYGPSSVAYILKDALEDAAHRDQRLAQLCIYVAQDCTIYMDDVTALCSAGSTEGNAKWRGVIILVPVRLGGERINSAYIPCVKAMLAYANCIGIIGGRPRHSTLLPRLGEEGERCIYLGTLTYCQEMVDVNSQDFPLVFVPTARGHGRCPFPRIRSQLHHRLLLQNQARPGGFHEEHQRADGAQADAARVPGLPDIGGKLQGPHRPREEARRDRPRPSRRVLARRLRTPKL